MLQLIEDLGLPLTYPLKELDELEVGGFLRTDTHLTLEGNRILATAVLGTVAADTAGLPRPETRERLAAGDLGARFTPPIIERSLVCPDQPGELVEDNTAQIAGVSGHLGTRTVVYNRAAPDRRVCVLFGDSYGSFGEHYQGLGWWLSFVFAELHFAWIPFGWDTGYLERVGAQVAIMQGAERFCVRAPKAEVDVEGLAREAVRRGAAVDLAELPERR